MNVRVFIFSIWNICNFESKSIQILFLLFGPNGLSVISRLKGFTIMAIRRRILFIAKDLSYGGAEGL